MKNLAMPCNGPFKCLPQMKNVWSAELSLQAPQERRRMLTAHNHSCLFPGAPATLCETAQGGAQAFPWRGSGCGNARCAIPTAAGGEPSSQGKGQPLQRPSPGSLQSFHRPGQPKPPRAWGSTGWEIDAPTHLLCFLPPVFGKPV